MRKITMAIDLLWVRPRQVGGIESYIRNLLDGLQKSSFDFVFFLLVSKDNINTFKHYEGDKRFILKECNVYSSNVKKRIIWQNLYLGNTLKKLNLKVCFEPYYCMPYLGIKGIKFITTIHDLQALHYPEYFSKGKVVWMKASWKNALKKSDRVVAISKFVKDDICNSFDGYRDKIKVIYNPVIVNKDKCLDEVYLKKNYNVNPGEFFFTLSSLLPHKNLRTIIRVMRIIKMESINVPHKLIISGVGGKSKRELEELVYQYGLEENIMITPFIDDNERNMLYKFCYAFLFPSLFEGFGMPPVEAMMFGVPVVTSTYTSLGEVTQGKAIYVTEPLNEREWIEIIKKPLYPTDEVDFSIYSEDNIAHNYFQLFEEICKG